MLTAECESSASDGRPTVVIWKEEKKGSRVGWHLSTDEAVDFLKEFENALKDALLCERRMESD